MSNALSFTKLLLTGALLSAPLPAAPSEAALHELRTDEHTELVREIEALVTAELEKKGAVGLSVAVAIGDEVLLSKGYGKAEVEHDVEADADTMFRIGSITKQFTAAAIMRLVEKDKIGLDEDITTYLPEYPTHGHTVTVRHLLTHTSGIPSYTSLGLEWLKDVSRELSHKELLEKFQDKPFDFAPGERWAYNNSGYYLLGMIIESVTRKDYDEYLAETFFEPLGLTRTRYGSNSDIIKNRSQGYRILAGKLSNDGLIGMSQPGAAGALLSTAGDLVRWQIALVSGKAVSEESYEEMVMPFLLNDTKETAYGFGLGFGERHDTRRVSHGGGIFGFNSMLDYYPEFELSVSVISNSEAYSSGKLSESICKLAVDTARAKAEAK